MTTSNVRNESKRLLRVLETRLTGRDWIIDGDYTIADISLLGWVRNLVGFYGARELVEFDSLTHVPAWLDHGLARPAVQRGLNIPKRTAYCADVRVHSERCNTLRYCTYEVVASSHAAAAGQSVSRNWSRKKP